MELNQSVSVTGSDVTEEDVKPIISDSTIILKEAHEVPYQIRLLQSWARLGHANAYLGKDKHIAKFTLSESEQKQVGLVGIKEVFLVY